MKEGMLTVTGRVVTVFNANAYEVQLENGHLVRCHRGGHARKRSQKPVPGDEVQIDLTPYNLNMGIIKKVLTVGDAPKKQGKRRH
ncbi:S1 domain-containing protein [Botrimarina mediterranea]|uniref:Translation initiation factor IF-1 n=1 Tax=Botrimarina mediterranea TaxID=2528022 RepID=A0A518K5J8_9BACT|nr:translation initiation factor IF-1 [Botrimarina mediterranea]QDV73073.1 Translation initiation factor IF-1 [Botrimarina mediterranea]